MTRKVCVQDKLLHSVDIGVKQDILKIVFNNSLILLLFGQRKLISHRTCLNDLITVHKMLYLYIPRLM